MEDRGKELESALRDQLLWIKHKLQITEGRVSRDERGHITNSWAVCAIPDWEMKQKRDWLQELVADSPAELAAAARAFVADLGALVERKP